MGQKERDRDTIGQKERVQDRKRHAQLTLGHWDRAIKPSNKGHTALGQDG